MSKMLHLSEPQFPHLYSAANTVVFLDVVKIEWGNAHSTKQSAEHIASAHQTWPLKSRAEVNNPSVRREKTRCL